MEEEEENRGVRGKKKMDCPADMVEVRDSKWRDEKESRPKARPRN